MRFRSGKRRDALHEIKDAFRLTVFLAQDGFDDFRCLGFGKAAFAQEGVPVIVGTGNDPFPGGLDAGYERPGRGIGKARQRWCRLVRKALRREFRMSDGDFFEVLDTQRLRFMQTARR
jgi:hypothetical protein